MSTGKFSLELSAWVKKVQVNSDLVVRRAIEDVSKRIVDRSPVGNRELWAVNDIVQLQRDTYRVFVEDKGKTVSNKALKKRFKTRGPKGYVGGRFRSNWQGSQNAPATGELYEPDDSSFPSGSETFASISEAIGDKPAGKRFFLMNNLPYALRLEDGYSTQAPSGMVGLTVIEWQQIVDAAAKEVNK